MCIVCLEKDVCSGSGFVFLSCFMYSENAEVEELNIFAKWDKQNSFLGTFFFNQLFMYTSLVIHYK